MSTYLLGDNDLAAKRLCFLAEVFEPSTRDFIDHAVTRLPDTVVDLGCGPGYTTRLLAETTGCRRAIGLDTSPRYISMAEQAANKAAAAPLIDFIEHDVTKIPFPAADIDLLYCRYLLMHLPEPEQTISDWATQLRPGGLLLVEDLEDIETDQPVFARYLEIMEAMMADNSNDLYIGRRLDHPRVRSLNVESSTVARLPVADKRAATLCYMNLQTWRREPFVQNNYAAETIDDLQRQLEAMTHQPDNDSHIEWRLRQIAFSG